MTQLPLISTATDIGAVAVAVIALVALIANRSFQVRDELGRLLKHYEAARFQPLMWRMEQWTRPAPGQFFSVDPISVPQLRKQAGDRSTTRRVLEESLGSDWAIEESLGSDWAIDRAHVHDVHFFALRVHAWLFEGPFSWRRHRTRLLNDTFGYRLVATLLDHRIVALRLRRDGKPDSYFPTWYGLFEDAHTDLVKRPADDLLAPKRSLPAPIHKSLSQKLRVTSETLAHLSPDAFSGGHGRRGRTNGKPGVGGGSRTPPYTSGHPAAPTCWRS